MITRCSACPWSSQPKALLVQKYLLASTKVQILTQKAVVASDHCSMLVFVFTPPFFPFSPSQRRIITQCSASPWSSQVLLFNSGFTSSSLALLVV